MYGKYFASTFTGSMVGVGPDVHAVWGYVLACKRDGHIELNPRLVASTIGKMSEKRAADAILFLCKPDPDSRNKDEEGKRLVRVGQFMYRVVSDGIYRNIRNEDERRDYNAQAQRESRARKEVAKSPTVIDKSNTSLTVNDQSAPSAHGEVDKEEEREGRTRATPLPPGTGIVQTETFGITDTAAIFSELRSAAGGSKYRRGTADYTKCCEATEWAIAEHAADPAAAVRRSVANYLLTDAKAKGWPFAFWANDPGRFHAMTPEGGGGSGPAPYHTEWRE